ncbi:MAG: hypothetical protein LBR64_07975 [Dysgonamonadaceae bacterium]|jgi:hypothetical protein|nr:hypothetical protein [Dysgonamonadaceae bacterium]
MKNIFFYTIAIFAILANTAQAQVKIGEKVPADATLDVSSLNANSPNGIIAPRMTLTELNAAKSKYTAAQTGAFVYIYDYSGIPLSGYSDAIICEGYCKWNGSYWVSECVPPKTYVHTVVQPKAFTFYEQGTEPEVPLVYTTSASSPQTYKWYKITGKNIHVQIAEPCTSADGTGFNTNSFTPKVAAALNSTNTKTASKNAFYRYYCVAKNLTGDSAVSNTAEIAVGCGGKNLKGEWVSFLCFNLGASRLTIADQKAAAITHSDYNDATGEYTYVAGEESLYGDLYQWGRIGDGHEKRNSAAILYDTLAVPVTENGNLIGTSQAYPANQISRTDPNNYYGKFIIAVAGNAYNWFPEITVAAKNLASDRLWSTERFLPNDPCSHINSDGLTYTTFYPATSSSTSEVEPGTGWRLPTSSDIGAIFRGGAIGGSPESATANTWSWWKPGSAVGSNGAAGYEVKPDGETVTLFLPAVGSRKADSGILRYAGERGGYWTGEIIGDNALYFELDTDYLNPAVKGYRAHGFALRCIKN